MKNSYGFQKNWAFTLISLLGFNYCLLVIVGLLKVLPGFLMQLILLLSFRNDSQNLSELLKSPNFYLNLFAGIFFLALAARILASVAKVLSKTLKTKKIVINLQQRYAGEYTQIESNIISDAFTTGVFKPQIYLSEQLINRLTEKELRAVLLHETYHKQQFDPLRSLVIMFARFSLPLFPFKKQLFESYDVLSELAADQHAENELTGKLPIVSALHKILSKNNLSMLGVSEFALNNNRIEILVGSKFFASRSFFSLLSFIMLVMMANTLLLSQTDIFMQCQHLRECFEILLHSDGNFHYTSNNICMRHAGDFIDHCMTLAKN